MLKVPAKSEFPGTGGKGNGIAEGMKSQAEWLNSAKTNGCMSCHALGTKGTRTIPKEFAQLQDHDRSVGTAHRLGPGDDQHDQRRPTASAPSTR